MRRAKEQRIWKAVEQKKTQGASIPFDVGCGTLIDLAKPCTVIGGRNGAGKSRLLRRIAQELGPSALLLDLHYLAEQALILLRERSDYDAMAEEAGLFGPDERRRSDVERVIKRDYESIEWFALEVTPKDASVADRFRWTGDQSLVPYFRAVYRGMGYTSRDMGLGEFTVHFLFWILEHYRTVPGLVILVDEPDAFLPPIGVEALLPRLLHICNERDWRLVLNTHSEEMIALAAENAVFTLLRVNESGETMAIHSADDPTVTAHVLSRPAVDAVLFVEDEVAFAMTRSLLDAVDPMLSRRISVIWGGQGHGYLRDLHKQLPRPPRPEVRFAYVFDGDQRGTVDPDKQDRWPAVFLPSHDDPNDLLKGLAKTPDDLATRLGVPPTRLVRKIDDLEGGDTHDWVDDLGTEFGRQQVLSVTTSVWAGQNLEEARTFVESLQATW